MGAFGAGEGHMQGALSAEVVAQGGLVVVADGHPANPGKNRSRLDFLDASQIHATWGQLPAIHYGEEILISFGVSCRHNGDLEGTITAALEESVGDAQSRQGGAKEHHPSPGRNHHPIGKF
jgi:hypothetical protein